MRHTASDQASSYNSVARKRPSFTNRLSSFKAFLCDTQHHAAGDRASPTGQAHLVLWQCQSAGDRGLIDCFSPFEAVLCDTTASVKDILGNTAVIKRREGITTTASATPIRILRIRASRINSARWQLSPLLQTTDERDNAHRQQATGADKQLNPVRGIPLGYEPNTLATPEDAATHSVVYKIKAQEHHAQCGELCVVIEIEVAIEIQEAPFLLASRTISLSVASSVSRVVHLHPIKEMRTTCPDACVASVRAFSRFSPR